MSFCYAHDYCQMHKGDASGKRLVYMKSDFSAMYDQIVTIKNCDSFKVILLSPSRDIKFIKLNYMYQSAYTG